MQEGITVMAMVQGAILSVLLFIAKAKSNLAAKWLSYLILATTFSIFCQFLIDYGYYNKFQIIFLLTTGAPFVLGPFLLLHSQSKLNTKSSIIPTYVHFIPIALYYIALTAIIFRTYHGNVNEFIAASTSISTHKIERLSLIGILKTCHLFIYTIAVGYQFLIKKEKTKTLNLQGLIVSAYVFSQLILLIFLIFNPSKVDPVFSTMMAAFLYSIGYLGLIDNTIFWKSIKAKYHSSALTDEEGKVTYAKLVTYMEIEKPYLVQELTMKKLAEMLNISESKLSQVVNQHGKMNFSDFVNYFRVEEIKKLIKSEQYQHLKISALALEAGFNNKNSFNKSFKKNTGLTPSEYRKSQRVR